MSEHPAKPAPIIRDADSPESARVQLFRLLLITGNDLRTRMDRRLAPIGVTTQQAALLTIVQSFPEAPSLGQVAEILGSTHQNAKQLATALSARGLMVIEVDPHDRRMRRLRVTPACGALFADRDDADRAALTEWFSALSDAEVAEMISGLLRIRGLPPPP
jgi:DNA-binding MarR family transcriptional regulator